MGGPVGYGGAEMVGWIARDEGRLTHVMEPITRQNPKSPIQNRRGRGLRRARGGGEARDGGRLTHATG
jgi:hypothetical protein